MNKYISIIVLVGIVGLGIWFSVRGKGESKDIINLDNQSASVQDSNSSDVSEAQEETAKKMTSAILNTNKGSITIEFLESQAPKTVANFLKLAEAGFYNGTKFHRVIKGFMIQGGDPLTKDNSKMDLWGTGDPGYKFDDELGLDNKNDLGTISMANAGPNTNGSQFFINVAPNNFLDDRHTVFGKVVAGMEVVKSIENVSTDASDRPTEPVIIESIILK